MGRPVLQTPPPRWPLPEFLTKTRAMLHSTTANDPLSSAYATAAGDGASLPSRRRQRCFLGKPMRWVKGWVPAVFAVEDLVETRPGEVTMVTHVWMSSRRWDRSKESKDPRWSIIPLGRMVIAYRLES